MRDFSISISHINLQLAIGVYEEFELTSVLVNWYHVLVVRVAYDLWSVAFAETGSEAQARRIDSSWHRMSLG